MQLEIKLREILADNNLDTHGIIQRISRGTGLRRSIISRLYHNTARNPSLDALGRICDWLNANNVHASLPQVLLGQVSSKLSRALTNSGVRVYLGEYEQQGAEGTFEWISPWDAAIHAELIRWLTEPDSDGKPKPPVSLQLVPYQISSVAGQVDSTQLQTDLNRSQEMFAARHIGGRSCIMVASQRGNLLTEHLVSSIFGCQPFQEPVGQARVPFFLSYHQRDRAVPSCFGGPGPRPGSSRRMKPGLHYVNERGRWTHCPWVSMERDAGIVVVSREEGVDGRVDMAVFGFSGSGTAALGKYLVTEPDKFWPPYIRAGDRHVGVFICSFELIEGELAGNTGYVQTHNPKVIPIAEKIMRKYLP